MDMAKAMSSETTTRPASGTIRAGLGLLRIELRRSLALLCFPLLVGITAWLALQGMPDAVYVWLDTSKAVRDTVLFTGPLVAGLSAWVASRNKRRNIGEMLSITPCPGPSRDLATWAGTALWGVAVYVVLAVGLGVPTWWNATWGGPVWGYLLIGLLGVVSDSTIGYAAGYHLPSRFTAPLVAVALFVGHLLPLGAMHYALSVPFLSPIAYSNGGFEVFQEPPQATLQQTLWFLGLAGTALATVALRGRYRPGAALAVLAVSATICVAGLVTALNANTGMGMYDGPVDRDVPFEPACEEGDITVCIHPAYSKLLPEAARMVNEVAEPIVGIPGAPTRAAQMGSFDFDIGKKEAKKTAFFFVYDLSMGDPGRFRSGVPGALVTDQGAMGSMMPGSAKPTREDNELCGAAMRSDYASPAFEAQSVVAGWLGKRAGDPSSTFSPSGCPNADELVERFASLPAGERDAWLEENFADLRAGKVILADLP